MTRRIKTRRSKAVKRPNPVARALRAAAFRARKERNRRAYTRKTKHRARPDAGPE